MKPHKNNTTPPTILAVTRYFKFIDFPSLSRNSQWFHLTGFIFGRRITQKSQRARWTEPQPHAQDDTRRALLRTRIDLYPPLRWACNFRPWLHVRTYEG